MAIKTALLVTFLFGLSQALPQRSPQHLDSQSYRLPNFTRPVSYDIFLSTNIHEPDEKSPGKFLFSGRVEIRLRVLYDTDSVTLHARQLEITEASLKTLDGQQVRLKNELPEHDVERDFITFHVAGDPLKEAQELILSMSFKGVLRTDYQGFYRSFYENEEGQKVWIASTQFEYVNSRHGFPCYDEPNVKASFTFTIDCGLPYFALSNMPVKEARKENGRLITEFQKIPSAHPSTIAFAVTDFAYISRELSQQTPTAFYARREAIANGQLDYALELCGKALRELERQLKTPFSLPKLDFIAIPEFLAGGMENWGLTNVREWIVLFDERTSSLSQKEFLARVMTHEIAHNFFGNLVSFKWWSQGWLKEGFANMFEARVLKQIHPEFDSEAFVVVRDLQTAFQMDSTGNSWALTTYIETEEEIATHFGLLLYYKGGAMLRMIQHAISEGTYLKGLKYYLDEMQFQAAETEDLARALQRAVDEDQTHVGIPIADILNSWTLQSGYPILNVRRENSTLVFTQEKYSLTQEPSSGTHLIPVTYGTASVPDFETTTPRFWVEGSRPAEVALEEESDWVIANVQQTGFYRVNYDDELWARIIAVLESPLRSQVHRFNRAQLVDDSLNLARAGYTKYGTALELVRFLTFERDFPAWESANKGFDFLYRQFLDSDVYELFKRYVSELVSGVYAEVGLEDGGRREGIGAKTLRNIAIKWACLTDDDECLLQTLLKVYGVVQNPETEIEPNTREIVYCSGLRGAQRPIWYAIWERIGNSTDFAARAVLMSALGCTQISELQQSYLLGSLTSEVLRVNERNLAFYAVLQKGGKSGIENAIDFLREHHREVEEKYLGPFPVQLLVQMIAPYVNSPAMRERFEQLLDSLVESEFLSQNEARGLLESVEGNIAWLAKNEDAIREYLEGLFKPTINSSK